MFLFFTRFNIISHLSHCPGRVSEDQASSTRKVCTHYCVCTSETSGPIDQVVQLLVLQSHTCLFQVVSESRHLQISIDLHRMKLLHGREIHEQKQKLFRKTRFSYGISHV